MSRMHRFPKSAATKSCALAAVLCALAACDKAEGPAASSKLLTVSAPKAGSAFKVGDSLTVTWLTHEDGSGKGREVSAIEVFLSPDGGVNWGTLTGTRAIQSGSAQWDAKTFKWKITDSLYIQDLNQKIPVAKGSQVSRLMIRDYSLNSDPDLADTTGSFTINP